MADMDGMTPEQIAEMQRQNCVFCKIIHGDIPSKKIFEDDKAQIILDINPAHNGHMLVLPKDHYQILPQIPGDVIGHLFVLAKKASKALLKGMAAKGTTIFVANGGIAGQKAPHFMIHVIPRDEGDGFFEIPKNAVDPKDLDETQSKIIARLTQMLRRPPVQVAKKTPVPVKQASVPTGAVRVKMDDERKVNVPNANVKDNGQGGKIISEKESNNDSGNKSRVSGKKDEIIDDKKDGGDKAKENVSIDDIANLFL